MSRENNGNKKGLKRLPVCGGTVRNGEFAHSDSCSNKGARLPSHHGVNGSRAYGKVIRVTGTNTGKGK